MKTRALPLRSRAPQGLEEIWDSNQRKLAVFVVECDEHVTDKDKLPLSITLNWGKIKQQTSQRKSEKSKNTVWNEFFLFSVDSGGPELTVEVVKSKKLGKDEVLGSAAVFHANEPPPEEKVIDLWVPLHRDSKKKVQVTSGEAKIHIRLLYSCSSETRPVEERGQQVFNYDDYVKQFKTGDLVLYSGIGLIHTYNKLLTNSEYSHAGLIFRLPNKWTRRDDVYVLEAQRNIDGFLDAFVEKPNSGLSLFRFFERIHQFHGLKIWFCPLTPSATYDSKVLVTEMWKTHSANIESSTRAQLGSRSGKQSETDKVYLLDRELSKELQGGSLSRIGLSDSGEKEKGRNFALVELLEGHHFQMKAPGIRFQLIDLLDAKLITTLLRRSGMGELTDKPRPKGTLIYPADVAEYKCFGKPVLIRDVDLNAEPKEESESGALPQQYYVVQNPMPMQFMPMMPQQGVPMGFPQQGFMPQQQQQQQFSPLQQQQLMQQQLLQQQQQQQMLQQQQQQQLLQQQQQQQLMQQQQLQQMQQQQRLSMPQGPQGFQQQPQYNPFMQQQGQQPPPLQPQRHSLENMFAPQHSPSYPSLTEQSSGNPPPFNPEFIEQVKASAGDEKNEKRKSPTILIH